MVILKKLGCGLAVLTLVVGVLSGCSGDTSASEGSGSDVTSVASTKNTTGWASSTDIFKQRWNSEIEAAYRINEFRVDSTEKNGGNFLAGTVYAVGNIFMMTTHNQGLFGSLCVQTTEAALGVPFNDAKAIVQQAMSSMQTSPNADGLVEYQGYDLTMQEFASSGELDCTISPKAP